MELAEPIERINQQLSDWYGLDTVTGQPIWRVVWANDQRELRKTEWSDDGKIYLAVPQVRELPKYGYQQDRYILERLVLVPYEALEEMAGRKISYEPMWTFEDKNGGYLPPKMDVCQFIIDVVYSAQGKKSLIHYLSDPDTPENKAKRLKDYEEYIFADKTDIGDALSSREGVFISSKRFGEE